MKAVPRRKRIPPLSQSRHGDMACETFYVRNHVECARVGESEPAARGVWMVEAINTKGEGEMLWAEFFGWRARERAEEFADWMATKSEGQQSLHQCNTTCA